MKRVTLLSLLLFFSGMAMSQQEAAPVQTAPAKSRNLGLEFNAGYSMVLGNYANADSNNSKSGYASGGWLMQFTFDWKGKGALGISLQYTFQHNALQASAEHVIPDGPFKYPLGTGSWSNHFALKFNIGYLAGWPSKTKTYGQQLLGYDEVIDPDTGIVIGYVPIYSAPAEYAIKKVISTLNPSLGAVFRF